MHTQLHKLNARRLHAPLPHFHGERLRANSSCHARFLCVSRSCLLHDGMLCPPGPTSSLVPAIYELYSFTEAAVHDVARHWKNLLPNRHYCPTAPSKHAHRTRRNLMSTSLQTLNIKAWS